MNRTLIAVICNNRHVLKFLLLIAGSIIGTHTHAQEFMAPALNSQSNQSFLLTPNQSGFAATVSRNGPIDKNHPFFQSLGTNGRSCGSCHAPMEGWSITPAGVRLRFALTQGRDPLFRTNDGANSPNADVSTLKARRNAYSMLLKKGVIRIGLPIPANAEFELSAVDDPYGFASASELSLFRRPLASANLKFLAAVQWDGRETVRGQPMHSNLERQAITAHLTHAQGGSTPLSLEQLQSIVTFEEGLFTAQIYDFRAQVLNDNGARGGVTPMLTQLFYVGINDLFGDSQTQAPFDPNAFSLYDNWTGLTGNSVERARASIARGQHLFNTREMKLTGVAGINDEDVFGKPEIFLGTCTTCHNTPNAGNRSVASPVNIGVSDGQRRTPDQPLYTLRNKLSGQIVQTTDPGRALVTGKWKDIGRFKSSMLRGLSTRPPYFHDGSAADLEAVVDFYDERFAMNLTSQEKKDFVAFMSAL